MNQYLIAGVLAGLLAAFLGGIGLGWHERSLRVPAEMAAQQDIDAKECYKFQKLTQDTNNDLQKQRDDIANELTALRLRQPTACVHTTGKAKSSNSGETGHVANNVSSDWLLNFAATCEIYRRAVATIDKFLDEERNGQRNTAQ